jgi:DNA-binding IclR family transcriptional regulator
MAAEPTLIGSVQRALHLLDAVGSRERPVSAKTLARETGLPLATAYHLLRTLVHEGYLRKLDDGYLLGDQVIALGSGLPAWRIRPTLTALRDQLSAACYLAVYRGGEIELVDIVDSPRHPRTDLWVGLHDAGHATALGKAILAELSAEQRDDYLARHQLADLTPRTVTDRAVLRHLLTDRTGLAVDAGEYHLGVVCVSAPIRTSSGIAAVAVSAPAEREHQLRRDSHVLRRGAERIGRALSLQ